MLNNFKHIKRVEECDYTIVGGGIGGVFTAYQLWKSKNSATKICLIEKEDKFGGRLYTYKLSNGGLKDIGGARINEDHTEMKNLAKELFVTTQSGEYLTLSESMDRNDPSKCNVMMVARDFRTNNPQDLKTNAFHTASSTKSGWDVLLNTDSDYYQQSDLQDTFSFTQYGLNPSKTEDMEYFLATWRYPGDFQGVDRRTYTEFANSDTINPLNHYPEKGMQDLVNRMMHTMKDSIKVMKGENVLGVWKENSDEYSIETTKRNIRSDWVILAVPPIAILNMTGNIISQLQSRDEIKLSKPVPVSTITMRYKVRWWESNSRARRIWTTSNCLQLIEQPLTEQGRNTFSFRVSYSDGRCANEWLHIYQAGGIPLIEKTVKTYLTAIYPTVNIPDPVETVYKYWEGAWHFEKPGVKYTMAEKEQWAMRPLEEEKIALVGEAYHIQRTWASGAIKSSMNFLTEILKIKINL